METTRWVLITKANNVIVRFWIFADSRRDEETPVPEIFPLLRLLRADK